MTKLQEKLNLRDPEKGRDLLSVIIELGITDSYWFREATDDEIYKKAKKALIARNRDKSRLTYEDVLTEILLQGDKIKLQDDEEDTYYYIGLDDIQKALWSDDFYMYIDANKYSTLDYDTWDSVVGDWIIQTAILGEIIFG